MGKVIINDIIAIMEEIAPTGLAADFDNPGFLVGDKSKEVSGIVIALDCNNETVDFAVKSGCNLIITHHPLIFHPVSSVTTDNPVGSVVYKLISSGVSLYSAHTNYDKADGGTDDILAGKIGLKNVKKLEEDGFGRLGETDITAGELKKLIEKEIGGMVISTADDNRKIHKAVSCAGAGGSIVEAAIQSGADVIVTGEMSYHEALDAKRMGTDVILCSHDASEQISMEALKNTLQNRINGVKYNIQVISAPFSPLWS